MPITPVTIDDGFGKQYESVGGKPNGNPQPETRDSKPDGTVQPASHVAGIPVIDPLVFSDAAGDGFNGNDGRSVSPGSEPRKRRGRPPGSKNANSNAAPKTAANLITDVEALIVSAHIMLAKMIDWEELELDDDEAKRLSNGLKEVAKYYTMEMDPKKLAWLNLSMIAGGIYGPRVIAAWRKNAKQRAEATPIDRPKTARNTEAAATGAAVRVEGQMVDRATAQSWASQGVSD